MKEKELCGRPTSTKRPCTQPWLRTFGPRVEGCHWHLTTEERQAIQEWEEYWQVRRDRFYNGDPACWSWPVPDELPEPPPREDHERTIARWQNFRCAICGDRHAEVTDHDHLTGLVRGKLCRSCNIQEGRSDDPVFQKYRARNPAVILGVEVVYWSPWESRSGLEYEALRNPASPEELKSIMDSLPSRLPRIEDLLRELGRDSNQSPS